MQLKQTLIQSVLTFQSNLCCNIHNLPQIHQNPECNSDHLNNFLFNSLMLCFKISETRIKSNLNVLIYQIWQNWSIILQGNSVIKRVKIRLSKIFVLVSSVKYNKKCNGWCKDQSSSSRWSNWQSYTQFFLIQLIFGHCCFFRFIQWWFIWFICNLPLIRWHPYSPWSSGWWWNTAISIVDLSHAVGSIINKVGHSDGCHDFVWVQNCTTGRSP